jgi:2-phosphosulfolactate phosphatase
MLVRVDVEFVAKDAPEAVNRGDLIIAVDVLRSSSSIVNALANGVKAVIPTETLKEAYKLREQHPDYLLAGERKGCKPRGFNLGNSPLEFVRDVVEGKTVIMTTTSGTAALVRCRRAEHVLVGAFLNAAAVANKAMEIAQKKRVNVSFVLAGEKGLFSLEDFLCAGAIASRFHSGGLELSDKTLAAVFAFERVKDALCEYVMKSRHARHLVELGLKADVVFSSELDHYDVVPFYKHGKVTLTQ